MGMNDNFSSRIINQARIAALLSTPLFIIVLEVLARAIKQVKTLRIPPKQTIVRQTIRTYKFGKVAEYNVTLKSVSFLYTNNEQSEKEIKHNSNYSIIKKNKIRRN